jgi:hypothetical protein
VATKTKKRRRKSGGSSRGKGEIVRIDFRKEEEGGGGGIRLPENDYAAKILKAKKVRSSEKDTPGIAVTFQLTEGKYKGKKITDRLWITPKSLWRIRALLEALGVTVPKKAVDLPLGKITGKELGITLTDDDPYQGRIRSRVSDFVDLETLGEDDEDEDEYEDEDEDEDEDEEDEDDDDLDDDDEEDDEDGDEEEEEEDEDEDDDDDLEELDLEDF